MKFFFAIIYGLIILGGMYLILFGPMHLFKIKEDKFIENYRDDIDECEIHYNSFIKGITCSCFGFSSVATILCGIQVINQDESIVTFYIWFLLFTIPTLFLFLISSLEKTVFTSNIVTFRNFLGINKTYNLHEIELYEFKNNIYAYQNGKKIFKTCVDSMQTIHVGNYYKQPIQLLDIIVKEGWKKLDIDNKPYLQKLVKWGKVQTCTEDKIVLRLMLMLSFLVEYYLYGRGVWIIEGIILLYIIYIADYITKKIILSEDGIKIIKFGIIRKFYKYSDISIKKYSRDYKFFIWAYRMPLVIYEIRKGKIKILTFSEKDPNIESLYYKWKEKGNTVKETTTISKKQQKRKNRMRNR